MHVAKSSLNQTGQTRFSHDEGYLLIVADGMGGAAAGEWASALAVETVEEYLLNTFHWYLHQDGCRDNELAAELRLGMENADRSIFERTAADPKLKGMGTTLTAAYSVSEDLFIIHAGDSRAYLLRDGELEQLTTDHTVVQTLVASGALSAEDARHHRCRNVVTNILGGPHPGVRAEIHKLRLQDGDVLLLCSDGLSEPVDDSSIASVLASAPSAQDAADHLVELALDGGGRDNITAVVARFRVAG